MDEDRKIRFLVSPMVFLVSFLWGLVLDPEKSLANILPIAITLPDGWPGLLALAAAGGSGAFTLGVAIGTITFVALRIASSCIRPRFGGSHEIAMSCDTREKAWHILGGKGPSDPRKEVFIGVSLDHGIVQARHEGIHKWIRRRWNAFSIAATSITAILLSIFAAWCAGVSLSTGWIAPALFMIAVFILSARWAWKDSMSMLSLMTEINILSDKPNG